MRLRFSQLPKSVQAQIVARYGPGIETKKKGSGENSPYAKKLQVALEERFPGLVEREYKPLRDRQFRIDFALPAYKIAIEFDGYRSHGISRKGFSSGLARQNLIMCAGWRFLRYTLKDVRDRLDFVLEQIESAIRN